MPTSLCCGADQWHPTPSISSSPRPTGENSTISSSTCPRHIRHPSHTRTDSRHHGSRCKHPSAGGTGRCAQRHSHVHGRQSQRTRARTGRKYGMVHPAAHPQERYYIFGREGAKMLASELNVPLLGQIPLVADICEQADLGSPLHWPTAWKAKPSCNLPTMLWPQSTPQ